MPMIDVGQAERKRCAFNAGPFGIFDIVASPNDMKSA